MFCIKHNNIETWIFLKLSNRNLKKRIVRPNRLTCPLEGGRRESLLAEHVISIRNEMRYLIRLMKLLFPNPILNYYIAEWRCNYYSFYTFVRFFNREEITEKLSLEGNILNLSQNHLESNELLEGKTWRRYRTEHLNTNRKQNDANSSHL